MNDESGIFLGIAITIFIFGLVEIVGIINGAARDDIYYKHITQAQEVCENNGGLYKIDGNSIHAHEFICNNSAVFMYTLPKTDESQ